MQADLDFLASLYERKRLDDLEHLQVPYLRALPFGY